MTDARGHSRRNDYIAIPSVLVPSVKECRVDHDITLSPMVRADHELLRASLPISLLRRDAVDDSATCCSGHTKLSSPTPRRWVLDDLARFQWLLKDNVFDPDGNIDLEVSRCSANGSASCLPCPTSSPTQALDLAALLVNRQTYCPLSVCCASPEALVSCVHDKRLVFGVAPFHHVFPTTVIESQISPALALWHQAHLHRALCDWNTRSLSPY